MENRPDVLIVARGGGSLEDLWPFNEEIVVRATADSEIPVISAVGHETDTTLIDYASDLRAPTPTAAAEKAVPVRSDLILTVDDLGRRAKSAIFRLFEDKANELKSLARALPKPAQFIDDKAQKLDNLSLKLAATFPQILQNKSQHLLMLSKLLESYSYKSVLSRGFAVVRSNGKIITAAANIKAGEPIELEFKDGKKIVGEKQGSLF
jgi:exodeoxyribonuclease VII large subunit